MIHQSKNRNTMDNPKLQPLVGEIGQLPSPDEIAKLLGDGK